MNWNPGSWVNFTEVPQLIASSPWFLKYPFLLLFGGSLAWLLYSERIKLWWLARHQPPAPVVAKYRRKPRPASLHR